MAVACLAMYIVGRGKDDSKLKSYEYDKHRMIRRRSYSLNEDGTRLLVADDEPIQRERSGTGSLSNMILRKNFEARVKNESGNSNLRILLQERRLQRQTMKIEKQPTTQELSHGQEVDPSVPELAINRRMISLLIVMFLFFMLNGGRDTLLAGLLFTYVSSLGWSTQAGTLLVTMYHVTRVVIHIAILFIIKYVSPLRLTLGNIVLLVASSGLMLATVQHSPFYLAAGVILSGFATSNLHPTAITLAQGSFKISGKRTCVSYLEGWGVRSVVFAPVAGFLLQSVGAVSFSAILFAISCVGFILLIVWVMLAAVVRRLYTEQQLDEVTVDGDCESSPLLHK